MLGISEAASTNADGSEVARADVVSPYEIIFKATEDMPKPPADIPADKHDLPMLLDMFDTIPVGTHLFSN